MSARPVTPVLRNAVAEDADAIYALKVAAFGNTFLPFTIYRSPKSVSYLRQLITAAAEEGAGLRIKVLVDGETVLGYYHGTTSDTAFFLNYIAVHDEARGLGLGSQLLLDFEMEARSLGLCAAALDVFTSNKGVPEWYFRHGYRYHEARYHVRLDIRALAPRSGCIAWSEAEWSRALEDEQRQGFARFTALCGESSVGVGLIDGCAAKLLSWPEAGLEVCVEALAQALPSARTELIVSGIAEVPADWPCLAVEQALRLRRELPGARGRC